MPGNRLRYWAGVLERAGVPSPQHDARALAAHVLGIRPGDMVLLNSIDPEADRAISELVRRRAAREPLQHITGSVGFLGLDLSVGPGVFVPRPETELLADHLVRSLAPDSAVGAEAAGAAAAGESDGLRVVDLCCGSGALGLALATSLPGVVGAGVEISPAAADYARRNTAACAEALAARGSRFEVLLADAGAVADQQLARWRGQVDLVVCNPPYVPDDAVPREPEARDHDPDLALYGGTDGLAVVRGLLGTVAALLRPGGLLAMEHADTQGESAGAAGLPELLRGYRRESPGAPDSPATSGSPGTSGSSGTSDGTTGRQVFVEVTDHNDLTGRPRFTTAIRVS